MVKETCIFKKADNIRKLYYGDDVYIRGIIEFSNNCVRNCKYCGLRKDNKNIKRYRMTLDEILRVTGDIYKQGIRTVVLQSGDDFYYTRNMMCGLISDIKTKYPGMAVTLSIGERPLEDYKAFSEYGLDRYLLKHETSNKKLYEFLHPGQDFSERLKILLYLKKIGTQIGSGVIIGLPFQSPEDLEDEIVFLRNLKPHMIGAGPFISQKDTPLAGYASPDIDLVMRFLAKIRMNVEKAMMPATTALETMGGEQARILSLRSGCNVVMINFTPLEYREYYSIYDNKKSSSLERARKNIEKSGAKVSFSRGDAFNFQKSNL